MNTGELVASGTLWVAIPIALLAGFVSFLSPCVLPLVPGYFGFIGGAVTGTKPGEDAAPTKSRMLLGVILFVLGFTFVFIAVTALFGTLGLFFLKNADLIMRIVGVIMIAMGLVFVGFFGVMQRTVKMQMRGTAGLIGAPLLGIGFAVGWTPCMGPTLAAINSLAVNMGDPVRGALLGLMYGLGLGIPFILIALGFGWVTKSVAFFRKHIRTVNIIGGVALIIVGLLMVSGIWTILMSRLGAFMSTVTLPI